MKTFSIIVALLFIGCSNNDQKDVTIFNLKKTNDSLLHVIDYKQSNCDSINTLYKKNRRFILRTKDYCISYAKIVKKNPSQSVFIETWTIRAFQWVDE